MPAIREHVRGLVERLVAGLDELGAKVAAPPLGPLVCIRSTDAPALVDALGAEGIVTSERDSSLRVSLHLYNTRDDVDAVLAALARHRPAAPLAPGGAPGGDGRPPRRGPTDVARALAERTPAGRARRDRAAVVAFLAAIGVPVALVVLVLGGRAPARGATAAGGVLRRSARRARRGRTRARQGLGWRSRERGGRRRRDAGRGARAARAGWSGGRRVESRGLECTPARRRPAAPPVARATRLNEQAAIRGGAARRGVEASRLAIFRALGDRHGEAVTLNGLGPRRRGSATKPARSTPTRPPSRSSPSSATATAPDACSRTSARSSAARAATSRRRRTWIDALERLEPGLARARPHGPAARARAPSRSPDRPPASTSRAHSRRFQSGTGGSAPARGGEARALDQLELVDVAGTVGVGPGAASTRTTACARSYSPRSGVGLVDRRDPVQPQPLLAVEVDEEQPDPRVLGSGCRARGTCRCRRSSGRRSSARRARGRSPGRRPCTSKCGKPSSSAVARKNMSRASMKARSSSSIVVAHVPLLDPIGQAARVEAVLQARLAS